MHHAWQRPAGHTFPAASLTNSLQTLFAVCLPSQDRRVEITGPTDRKMVINALNRWGRLAAVCASTV